MRTARKSKEDPVKSTPEYFNFWKGNDINKHYKLSPADLISKFKVWIPTKEAAWLERYDTLSVVHEFVGREEGLGSVGNDENNYLEYQQMAFILKPVKREYLDSITK
jgi:hypothetical protein